MSDTVKVTIYVSTDKVGSRVEKTIEFDAEEWLDMDFKERDEVCHECLFDECMIDWGWEEGE